MNDWEGKQSRPDDFFAIGTPFGLVVVSAQTAQAIEAALDQEPPPRWITFRDLGGSRQRIRSRHIGFVEERTAAQRASARAYARARKAEEKADGWVDGDGS